MSTPLKNLPGYIGYLIGSFFISVIWLVEKITGSLKFITGKRKRNFKDEI